MNDVEKQPSPSEEDEYNSYLQMQIEEQIEAERAYAEMMANEHYVAENEIPITEKELFRQILEDERKQKAHIKVVSIGSDQEHYGITYYHCSECGNDCKKHVKKCPHCGVEFNEPATFEGEGYPFGGSDFL